jgi:hypothetical protein
MVMMLRAPVAAEQPRIEERAARRPPREADERPVVGLGDHVPQFLLRPARLDR